MVFVHFSFFQVVEYSASPLTWQIHVDSHVWLGNEAPILIGHDAKYCYTGVGGVVIYWSDVTGEVGKEEEKI